MTRINPTYGRPYPPPARHPDLLDRLFVRLLSTDYRSMTVAAYIETVSLLWRAIGRAA